MNRLFKFFCFFICCFFLFTFNVSAKEITLYLFHGDGCPHCKEEIEFLDTIEDKYPGLKIVKYEVWYNDDNSNFMYKVATTMDPNRNIGLPLTIIGDTMTIGYGPGTASKIERAIEYYSEEEYVDVVEQIKNGTYVKEEVEEEEEKEKEKEVSIDDKEKEDESKKESFSEKEEQSDEEMTIEIPLIGKINLKNVSIISGTVFLGLLDGFNPCAMWILLFLISMLIGMKDRKRMWVLGLGFLLTSAFVYMAIMLSWLNIVVRISTVIWIRNLIAVVALVGGIINLRNFFKSQDSGCTVVDDKKRKKIFTKIKKFTSEKSLLISLIGVMTLAVSVNVVELACSAGLPLVFTQLLALNNIVGGEAIWYTFIYIVFFLFDDLVIFFIAMFTMKVTGISTKYSKYSHLIGGMLMIIIGILLLFRPEWLMFGGF